jgi:hypothetical protein
MNDDITAGSEEKETWQQIEGELRKSRKPCARCHCPAEAHEHNRVRWHCSLCSCPCYLGLPRLLYWLFYETSVWVWVSSALLNYAAHTGLVFWLHAEYGRRPYPWWAGWWMIPWMFLLYVATFTAICGLARLRRKIRRPPRSGDVQARP